MYDRPDYASESLAPHDALATGPGPAELWGAIPPHIDILVTHTPPYAHCDGALGCRDLRKKLATVRPRLHICGHVHQERGAERVRWNLNGAGIVNDENPEASVERWDDPHPDPASAKISLVDLTARGGKRPLDFHDPAPAAGMHARCGTLLEPVPRVSCSRSSRESESLDGVGVRGSLAGGRENLGRCRSPDRGSVSGHGRLEPAMDVDSTAQQNPAEFLGRRETCVVNCAIVATGWPHVGGKRFNKPIVVDLDLPIWR